MRWIVWHSRSWFTVVLALASCTCTFSFFRSFFIYRVMPLNVVFFSLQTSLSCVCIFLSQSYTHTHSLVLTVSCTSSSLSTLPPFILSYIPSFFPHIFWDPSTSSLLAPTRSVHVIYRHSVTASLDGRLGHVPLDRVVKIGQICTTIESVRSIEYTQSWCIPARYPVSQGLSVIGQRVHAKALKMELFMIDSGMQTEPCSLASSP